MKRPSLLLASVAIASLAALSLIAAQPDKPKSPAGFLGGLQKGQAVALKDLEQSFEITVFPNGPGVLGFEIVEVGPDFVVMQDVAKAREVRIPIYAIKSITTLKAGGK